MPAAFVHGHLRAFELVELFSYGSFVFRCQPGPRLVRPSVVVVRLRHLDVVVEPDDLLLFQLLDGRPEAQLAQKEPLLLLFLLLLLRRALLFQNIPLFQLFLRGPHAQPPDQPGADRLFRFLPFILRLYLEYVPIDQLLTIRSQRQFEGEALFSGDFQSQPVIIRHLPVFVSVIDRTVIRVAVTTVLLDYVRSGVFFVL
jgi:hypothetical protein